MTNPVVAARAALARASKYRRDGTQDEEAIAAARAHLTEVKLERAVRDALESDPPPSAEQRQKLAALVAGGAK